MGHAFVWRSADRGCLESAVSACAQGFAELATFFSPAGPVHTSKTENAEWTNQEREVPHAPPPHEHGGGAEKIIAQALGDNPHHADVWEPDKAAEGQSAIQTTHF